jgi:hypothetical protein
MQEDDESVFQVLHIEGMKEDLRELSRGRAIFGGTDEELPLEVEEQFLEYVLAFERAEKVTHREMLERDGVPLPPPDELTEEEVAQALANVIRALAWRRTFLMDTDHLSDRELYGRLWCDLLEEAGPVVSPESRTNCHIDLVGSGSEEDINLWLTYYADAETRAQWAADFPDKQTPPHREPPHDRDRFLPKPPAPR